MARIDVEDADQAVLGLRAVRRALCEHKKKIESVLSAIEEEDPLHSLDSFRIEREEVEAARVQVLSAIASVDEIFEWIGLLSDEDFPEACDIETLLPSATASFIRRH